MEKKINSDLMDIKYKGSKKMSKSVKYNKFWMIGEVIDVDARETGSAMIWISAYHRDEIPVKGAPVPTWFTSVIAVRIPAYVLESTDKAALEKGETVVVEGRLQGVKRNIEGKDFFIAEVQASKLTVGEDKED